MVISVRNEIWTYQSRDIYHRTVLHNLQCRVSLCISRTGGVGTHTFPEVVYNLQAGVKAVFLLSMMVVLEHDGSQFRMYSRLRGRTAHGEARWTYLAVECLAEQAILSPRGVGKKNKSGIWGHHKHKDD